MARRNASGSITSSPSLELEVGGDGEQVGVAGALAVAVDRALHVGRAGADRRDGVGGRAAGVVVAVGADSGPGRGDDVGDDLLDLVREHAPVGVAEHDDLGAGLVRGAHDRQGVVAVEVPAVEEVLAVEEDAAAPADEVADGVTDHLEVLPEGRAQRPLDVAGVGLRDEAHDRRLGVDEGTHEGVLRRDPAGATGGPEGGEGRVTQVEPRSWPARRTRCPSGWLRAIRPR